MQAEGVGRARHVIEHMGEQGFLQCSPTIQDGLFISPDFFRKRGIALPHSLNLSAGLAYDKRNISSCVIKPASFSYFSSSA